MIEASPAVCGRGLKQSTSIQEDNPNDVARRVRAWIETTGGNLEICDDEVARRVRAWIETAHLLAVIEHQKCRPPCAGVD